MNPFLSQVLAAIARTVIVYVAARTGHDLTDEQAAKIVLEYVVPVAVMLWSIYQKYRAQQKLVTSIANPKLQTERQVETVIANGGAASVLTPKTVVPQQG